MDTAALNSHAGGARAWLGYSGPSVRGSLGPWESLESPFRVEGLCGGSSGRREGETSSAHREISQAEAHHLQGNLGTEKEEEARRGQEVVPQGRCKQEWR